MDVLVQLEKLTAIVEAKSERLERIESKLSQPENISGPYLTADEAAVYCRVSKKTIYNQRRHIPRQQGVGKLLFRKEDLDKWLSTRPKKRK